MNTANGLTLTRILLIPVFMTLLLGNIPYGRWWAAALFAVAALTDSLDGYFARRHRSVTIIGQFLDPLADKLIVSAALISLVELRSLSAWVAVLIITREFAVSGLRMVAAGRGLVVPAYGLGKLKTVSQVIAIIIWIVVRPTFPLVNGPAIVAYLSMGIALALTIVSGAEYFWRSWPLLASEGAGDE